MLIILIVCKPRKSRRRRRKEREEAAAAAKLERLLIWRAHPPHRLQAAGKTQEETEQEEREREEAAAAAEAKTREALLARSLYHSPLSISLAHTLSLLPLYVPVGVTSHGMWL